MMSALEWREFRDRQRNINSIKYRGRHGYYPTPKLEKPEVDDELNFENVNQEDSEEALL